MCLDIDDNVKAKKPNKDGFCMAWKTLHANDTAIFRKYQYKIGINTCENRVHPIRKYDTHIYEGLHLFLRRENARSVAKNEGNSSKVIKVYYKPEDVIAYGFWNNDDENDPSVVVKKLTVKSLKGE